MIPNPDPKDDKNMERNHHFYLSEEHECLIFEVKGEMVDHNFHLEQMNQKLHIVLDLCNKMD